MADLRLLRNFSPEIWSLLQVLSHFKLVIRELLYIGETSLCFQEQL